MCKRSRKWCLGSVLEVSPLQQAHDERADAINVVERARGERLPHLLAGAPRLLDERPQVVSELARVGPAPLLSALLELPLRALQQQLLQPAPRAGGRGEPRRGRRLEAQQLAVRGGLARQVPVHNALLGAALQLGDEDATLQLGQSLVGGAVGGGNGVPGAARAGGPVAWAEGGDGRKQHKEIPSHSPPGAQLYFLFSQGCEFA